MWQWEKGQHTNTSRFCEYHAWSLGPTLFLMLRARSSLKTLEGPTISLNIVRQEWGLKRRPGPRAFGNKTTKCGQAWHTYREGWEQDVGTQAESLGRCGSERLGIVQGHCSKVEVRGTVGKKGRRYRRVGGPEWPRVSSSTQVQSHRARQDLELRARELAHGSWAPGDLS